MNQLTRKKILVTGGAGFIGGNFVQYMIEKYSNYDIYNLDFLTYARDLTKHSSLHEGVDGEAYNIGGHNERTNLQVIKQLALGKSEKLIEFVEDRLGHDKRYAINPS